MMRSPRAMRMAFAAGFSFVVAQPALAGGGASNAATMASGLAAATILPSIATGTALQVPCTQPGGQAACAMMVLAFMQAAGSMGNSSSSGNSASQLSSGSSGRGAVAPSADYTKTTPAQDAKALQAVGLGSLASDYSSLKAAVAASGAVVSPDGSQVTLPGGKTIPTSALGSDAGMKRAGFSDAEIATADNALKSAALKVEAAKSKIASLTNDQGGGGGGLNAGGETSGSSPGGGYNPYLFQKQKANAGTSLAGMSKKVGNDSIGVAGDDIFEMISRRYQARDKADGFLKK